MKKSSNTHLLIPTFPHASTLLMFSLYTHQETKIPSVTPPMPLSPPKKVRFFKELQMILIPERKEYIEAHLNELLWNNERDYIGFKRETLQEINEYIQKNPLIPLKKAFIHMHQLDDVHPENIKNP